tara:strand:- start:3380 stop:4645 length:1266 start_codon:yes stop_codon:yes gene_type:complete
MVVLFLIFLGVIAFKRPSIALAIVLQINNIKALLNTSFGSQNYTTLENDISYGVMAPLITFVFIFLRLNLKKKLFYKPDYIDLFFILITVGLAINYFFVEDSYNHSIESIKILFLGFPYFFLTKLYFTNVKVKWPNFIKSFFLTTVYLSTIMGVMALYFYYSTDFIELQGYQMVQLTYPGVYVIPFAQMIGLSIIGIIIILFHKKVFEINKIWHLIVILIFLFIVLLLTKNRGIQLSTAISVFFFFFSTLSLKIPTKFIIVSTFFVTTSLLFFILNPEISEDIFQRIINSRVDKSVIDRIEAYKISVSILLENPFGIGPSNFKNFFYLDYVHNVLLEMLIFFGLLGIPIVLILTALLYKMVVISLRMKENTIIILTVIFLYFFIEAQFSFTLWMQKGLFFSLALLSSYKYLKKIYYNHESS